MVGALGRGPGSAVDLLGDAGQPSPSSVCTRRSLSGERLSLPLYQVQDLQLHRWAPLLRFVL